MSRNLMVLAVLIVFGLGCVVSGPSSEPPGESGPTTQEDLEVIAAVRGMEVSGIESGDLESSLSAFASDIVFMPPNEPTINGKEGLRAWMAPLIEQFDMNLEYPSAEVEVTGDRAFEHFSGTLTLTPDKEGGDALAEEIKGIHIYRREADGSWRITHDIWSPKAPPPAASSPPELQIARRRAAEWHARGSGR